MRLPRLIRKLTIGAVALLAAETARAQQQPCNAAPFLAVSSWTGTVSIVGAGSGTLTDSLGNVFTYDVHQSIQLGPVLTVSKTSPSSSTGPENASFNVNDTWTTTQPGLPTSTTVVTASSTTALGFFNDGAGLSISSLPVACGYAFGADDTTSSYTVTVDGQPGQTTELNWGATNIPNLLDPPGTPTSPQTFVPFPTSGTTLSGSVSFNGPSWDIPSNFPNNAGPVIHWTITWSFSPTPRPLDLIVTVPNYATWRPTGGLTEIDFAVIPGQTPNFLEITAQLFFKDTHQPTDFGPNQLTFALTQVSSEPGVAMNWPSKGQLISPTPPDLSFKDLSNLFTVNPGFTLNADGTQATLTPTSTMANPPVSIFLVPYDWGGWATLSVSAEVTGFPTLEGHFATNTSTDILLPKRQPGSFIADSWKNEPTRKIPLSTSDLDDSETNPTGAGQSGDGLTLYEEYRGFYMGCKDSKTQPQPEGAGGCQRVEGNPAEKDLFVVDTIPTIADDGVKLFKETTGLNVHYLGMTLNDVAAKDPLNSGAYRVINFNHTAGPHVVDEHALVIQLGPQVGFAEAINTDDFNCPVSPPFLPHGCRPGLPKEEDHVALMQDALSVRARLSPQYLDAIVAHELAHSVDVYHHGDFEQGKVTWQIDSSGNITEDGNIVYVKYEGDDPSIPGTTYRFDPSVKQFDLIIGNYFCTDPTRVGINGLQSGDVGSYMRYNETWAYIPQGFPQVRFWTGLEPFGHQLTNHPQGSDFNDPNRAANFLNHRPGPRYGDAFTGAANQAPTSPQQQRGNDSAQFDVNDSHTALIRPTQQICP